MPMKNDNNVTEEDNNIDQSLSSSHNNNHAETVNTLIRENAKTINTANAKDNEKSQKINWWISELNSLGMKKSKQEEESNKSRELENLTDDIKQKFIYDYKTCYSE
jgi:gamma-glutamyl phosphate reductase